MGWGATGNKRPVRSDCELDLADNCVEPPVAGRRLIMGKMYFFHTPDKLIDV